MLHMEVTIKYKTYVYIIDPDIIMRTKVAILYINLADVATLIYYFKDFSNTTKSVSPTLLFWLFPGVNAAINRAVIMTVH